MTEPEDDRRLFFDKMYWEGNHNLLGYLEIDPWDVPDGMKAQWNILQTEFYALQEKVNSFCEYWQPEVME